MSMNDTLAEDTVFWIFIMILNPYIGIPVIVILYYLSTLLGIN